MSYGQRHTELRESIESRPPAGMPEADRRVLLAAVNEWGAERASVLGGLCILLQPGSSDAGPLWRSGVDRLRDHLRRFSESLRNVSSPIEGSLHFIQSNAAADERFISAVGNAAVAAEARDYMVKYLEIVRQETASLEVKWNAVTSQHASYQQQELAVIEQLDALIRNAIVTARDLDSKVVGLIADWLSKTKDALQSIPEGGADAMNVSEQQ